MAQGFAKPRGLQLIYADGSVPSDNTIANTTTELFFGSRFTFPANALRVGQIIRVTLFGLYGTTAIAPTLTGNLYLNTTALLSSGALTTILNLTNQGWSAEALLIVTAVGVSGTIEVQGYAEFATAATTSLSVNLTNTAAVTIDTTQPQTLQVSMKWSAADPANTITLRQMLVELIQ